MDDFKSIQKRLNQKKINVYPIFTIGNITKNGFSLGSIDAFMEFISKQKISSVFVYEQYESPEDYLISNELIEKETEYLDDEFLIEIMPQIEQYNFEVEHIDFDNPSMLLLMCIFENNNFYVVVSNGNTDNLIEANEMFKIICNENEDKLNEIKVRHKEKIDSLKEDLRNYVLSDNEFLVCTNKDLRMNYAKKLFNEVLDEHFLLLKKYWTRNKLGMLYQEAYDFFDMLWNELKTRK